MNFVGDDFGVAGPLVVPPDPMVSVGQNDIIVSTNQRFVSYNKFTGVQSGLNLPLNTFWQRPSSEFLTDPKVVYDRFSQRWFAVVLIPYNPPTQLTYKLLLAYTLNSGVQASNWVRVDITQSFPECTPPRGAYADYPWMGIDAQAIYIGTNRVCTDTLTSTILPEFYTIPKQPILAGQSPRVVRFFGSSLDMTFPVGVDNDDPNPTAGYFASMPASYAIPGRGNLRGY